MNLWDLVKKGAEDGFEVLKDGLVVFRAEAGKKSRILRKKVQLTAVQGHVRKAFTRLGTLAYELHSQGQLDIHGNEDFKGLISQIEGYEARVREIEAEIDIVRREEGKEASGKAREAEHQAPLPHF